MGAAAGHPPAASAAGAARPGLSRLADPGNLRRRRPSGRVRAALRADQRVRGRVPHRRSDRAHPRRAPKPAPSARAPRSCTRCPRPSVAVARACRSRCCCRLSASCSARTTSREADIDALGANRRPGPRGALDLPGRNGRARGRAGRADRGAAGRARPATGSANPRRATTSLTDEQLQGVRSRLRPPAVADHGRARHRQNCLDPDDRRRGDRAECSGAPGGAHRTGGGPDERGQRNARHHRPFGARLDSGRGSDPRRGGPPELRPADRRRDLDGQPRAARHAAARGRPQDPRGARRRRRPARAGRRRKAVRRADRVRQRCRARV